MEGFQDRENWAEVFKLEKSTATRSDNMSVEKRKNKKKICSGWEDGAKRWKMDDLTHVKEKFTQQTVALVSKVKDVFSSFFHCIFCRLISVRKAEQTFAARKNKPANRCTHTHLFTRLFAFVSLHYNAAPNMVRTSFLKLIKAVKVYCFGPLWRKKHDTSSQVFALSTAVGGNILVPTRLRRRNVNVLLMYAKTKGWQ